mmetsp:Transcript_25867/g.65206  ORF Transcript_25867/g.65206 Transcript_25867/m.65206 type:complete len:220 (+) Transcript_25867:1398-2057(+)
MLRGHRAGGDDVSHDFFRVDVVRGADFLDAVGAEGTLGVDVHALAGEGLVQLRLDRQRVAQLRLAATELPVEFGDAAGLDASAQNFVQAGSARGDFEPNGFQFHEGLLGGLEEATTVSAMPARLGPLGRTHCTHRLVGSLNDLVHLCLPESFDGDEVFAHDADDGVDGGVAGRLQLRDVGDVDARVLEGLDLRVRSGGSFHDVQLLFVLPDHAAGPGGR